LPERLVFGKDAPIVIFEAKSIGIAVHFFAPKIFPLIYTFFSFPSQVKHA
jgi:hypothetical protein